MLDIMTVNWQQGVPKRENDSVPSRSSITLCNPWMRLGVTLVTAMSLFNGCDCAPARTKPWRMAPDPQDIALERPQNSELVDVEASRLAAREQRLHTLRVHMDREPRHLNPLVNPSVWTLRVAFDTIFESLIRYEPPAGGAGTGPGHYEPGLARAWTVSANGREIKLEIEPDVVFHDGKRLTSVDVQFSLDAARSTRVAAGHLRDRLADVTAVELVDSRSVRIRLSRPNAYVLRTLASVPILPTHVYRGKLSATRGPVVGTGPYRLLSWQSDAIHLQEFDGYWGRKPAIPDLVFAFEPDAARALTAAKRGDLDLVSALIPTHYPEQASSPGLVSAFQPLRLRPSQLSYALMNAGRAPLEDARVRQAIALLIERKALIKETMRGLARPIAGHVWPGGPGDGAAPPAPAFDPAAAAVLLDEAGWRDRDRDGIRERDGKSLRLSLLVLEQPDTHKRAVRERVVRALRRTGILVQQRAGTTAVLRNRMRAGDYDLVFIEWRGSVDVDLSPLFETGGKRNLGQFSDARVDQSLSALRAAGEPSSRAPLMGVLARYLAKSWPIAPIAAPDPYGLLHRRVRGAVVWDGWVSLRALSLSADDDTRRY